MVRRLWVKGDDTGSLMLAMILTMVATMLSAAMIPLMLNQFSQTRTVSTRVHQLDAAQAGLDVAVGQIRASGGTLANLPCGTMTGALGTPATARYQVSITYYPSDPAGQSAAWLSTNQILCISGGGTLTTPAYALLQAQGTDQATGSFTSVTTRSLSATYIFTTNNQNIPGGLIHVSGGSPDLCLDAGSSQPTAGTNVTMQPCVSGKGQQTWAYNDNLTVVLVTSKTSTMPLGMCVDAGTPEATNAVLKVQACGSPTKAQQQWSFNDSAQFQGTSDGSTLNNFCWNVQTANTAGSLLILSGCGTVFSPEAGVGAGMAGGTTTQLVNYNQFGRCLDVTNQNVNQGFLIAWPCKQSPAGATGLTWNQKWALPANATGNTQSVLGTITTNPGSLYCLTSPNSTAYGTYVTTQTCNGGANQLWTVYYKQASYGASWVIKDNSASPGPYCLSPTDPNASPNDMFGGSTTVSKIQVATCNGSTLQKWNAPRTPTRSRRSRTSTRSSAQLLGDAEAAD